MEKIPSLFKRDYGGNRQVVNETVEGSEWVVNGEGVATIKWDGTCCKVDNGILYKRYDRKLTKSASRKKKRDRLFAPTVSDFKSAPNGWQPCEDKPNLHTGHWPGWLRVDFKDPSNKWHKEAVSSHYEIHGTFPHDGTWELVGAKVQGNPYGFDNEPHELWAHGMQFGDSRVPILSKPPRTYELLKSWFSRNPCEGIVWHHPDGRMVKIKRKDFGLPWPVKQLQTI